MKRDYWDFCLKVGVVLLSVSLLGAILLPNFICCRNRSPLTACKSNLKNIGTALEMYSTDWSGHYPGNLAALTPNYLKTLPVCPQAGVMTYRAQFGMHCPLNTAHFEDYYEIQCTGSYHSVVNVPPDYPRYDGIQGLIER